MNIKPFLIFPLLIACSINSDDYQIKSLKVSPEMVLPLATGNLSIQDILNKTDVSFIKVDPDGLVYLTYEETLVTQDIRDLITIPDLATVNRTLVFPSGNRPASNADVNSTISTSSVDMGITPEKLTEIYFKSGSLNYNVNLTPSNSNVLFAVIIKIPEYKNEAGLAFQQTVSDAGSFSLQGYTFKNAMANTFTLDLTLVIKAHNNAYVVAPGTNVNVSIAMSGLDFKYVRGFFNDQTANPASQTLDIGTFGDFLEEGSATFAQPKIELDVINDYGVPLEVAFSSLEAVKPGSSLPILINPASPVTITPPATLGTSAITAVAITNVNPIFNFKPSQFRFQVSGRINKDLISGNNFMADTSKMRVKMKFELPLYGKASGISLSDTVELDLGDLDQSQIETAGIKAFITNELPLDANIQLTLTDANYAVLATLISPAQTNLVMGSTVDNNGLLQSPGTFNEVIELDPIKINKLFAAQYLIVSTDLNTSKNTAGTQVDVKFLSTLKIDIKLGLQVKLKLVVDL